MDIQISMIWEKTLNNNCLRLYSCSIIIQKLAMKILKDVQNFFFFAKNRNLG